MWVSGYRRRAWQSRAEARRSTGRRSEFSCWTRVSRAFPGDMGNAETWPFPVLYRVVRGASPERVVLQGARGLLPDFLAAAAELVALGAEAITTNCGFLSLFQRELAAHVGVPVATSSLMQVPWVQAALPPGQRVGVVTVSAVVADAGASGGGRRAGRHAGDRHRERARVLPRADPRRVGGHGRRRWPSRTWWRPGGSWSGSTMTSARSSWSAPTCRPMPRRCARRSGGPCTTSTA